MRRAPGSPDYVALPYKLVRHFFYTADRVLPRVRTSSRKSVSSALSSLFPRVIPPFLPPFIALPLGRSPLITAI